MAVGGFFGYWFAMPRQPTGMGPSLSGYLDHYPRRQSIGRFYGNKAHSVLRNGIHVDDMLVDGTGLIDSEGWEPADWSFISSDEMAQLKALPAGNSFGLISSL